MFPRPAGIYPQERKKLGIWLGSSRTGDMSSTSVSENRLAPGIRHFGRYNWRGLWTLYVKEIQRFTKIKHQTLTAPAINSLLFLLIFSVAMGKFRPAMGGVPFAIFMAPGLIMMGVMQNAFGNSSSSMLVSKVQGNIVDVLMPPISAGEMVTAYTFGAATRGAMVAFATYCFMWVYFLIGAYTSGQPIVGVPVTHVWAVLFYGLGGAMLLAQIGLLAGIWADKFDHMATVQSFVIMPLTFLSGTFYSVSLLPEPWKSVSFANPFFYLIDGFRYGFIGHAESNLAIGAGLIIGLNVVLWTASLLILRSGYKLRP